MREDGRGAGLQRVSALPALLVLSVCLSQSKIRNAGHVVFASCG